jgi:hypothetical protein
MLYSEWADAYGLYRWYRKDGSPRILMPLGGNYKSIYDIVTREADLKFNCFEIQDIIFFTNEFLSEVSTAWMKFKTELELVTGTLDGTNIDPNVFEAGYDRTTTQTITGTVGVSGTTDTNITSNDTIGQRTDNTTVNTNDKARNIQYNQGVQAFDTEITNDDIGELGRNWASGFSDAVQLGDQTTEFKQGEQENTSSQTNKSTGTQNTTSENKFSEEVHEKRINYYDNLAFLRDRFDRIKDVKPFYEYLMPCFKTITVMSKNW